MNTLHRDIHMHRDTQQTHTGTYYMHRVTDALHIIYIHAEHTHTHTKNELGNLTSCSESLLKYHLWVPKKDAVAGGKGPQRTPICL